MNDFGVSGVMINVLLAAILFTDVTTHTFTHTYSSYAYIVFLSHILCHSFTHLHLSLSLSVTRPCVFKPSGIDVPWPCGPARAPCLQEDKLGRIVSHVSQILRWNCKERPPGAAATRTHELVVPVPRNRSQSLCHPLIVVRAWYSGNTAREVQSRGLSLSCE